MKYTSESIEKLVEAFASLPSIGRKTAQRLTYFILRQSQDYVDNFASALQEVKEKVHYCTNCHNYTETDPCPICSSEKRDKTTICVVEEPTDVIAVEKTHDYFGQYHVLHGVLNPLEGITPDRLKIKELLQRLEGVNEVILALNPSVEGEVTTQYISKMLKPLGVKVTRIASGVPMGSSLEYSDEATLTRALQGRIMI